MEDAEWPAGRASWWGHGERIEARRGRAHGARPAAPTIFTVKNPLATGAPCYVCGSSSTSVWVDRKGFRHAVCSTCRLVRLDPVQFVSPETIYTTDYYDGTRFAMTGGRDAYPPSYARPENPHRSHYYRKYATELTSRLRTSGTPRLLDYGCGYGSFLRQLAARAPGAELHGCEVDAKVCAAARAATPMATIHQASHPGDIRLPAANLDGVAVLDVVEHLEDPRAVLTSLAELSKDDAVLLVTTPNIESLNARLYRDVWSLHSPPLHTYYFGGTSLRLLLAQSGWAPERLWTERTILHNERYGQETWRGRSARWLFGNAPMDWLTNQVAHLGSVAVVVARRRR